MLLKTKLIGLALISTSLLAPEAYASSTFNGSATVSINIENIINQTHAGDLSGLTLQGNFDLRTQYQDKTGDGDATFTHTGDNNTFKALTIGDTLTQTLSLQGGASDGYIDTYYQTSGLLKLINASSDTYQITLGLDYSLDAQITGSGANMSVYLEDYNESYDISGSADITADSTEHTATTGPITDNVVLTLGGNTHDNFYTDITFSGYAEASPVPVPAAGWLMMSCLVFLQRFRSHKA